MTIDTMNIPSTVEVHYSYTSHEKVEREQLISLIEAEKQAYLKRIEPYLKLLANIQGTPFIVVNRQEK